MKKMPFTYKHTLYASYLGYITQAIVNNLPPLLFIIFQKSLGISLGQLGFLVSLNFGVQMLVDLLSAKFAVRIGYRFCIVAAHICSTVGLLGLGIFPRVLSDPYAGLVLSMVISAVGGGLIEVLVSPIVQALPGEEKASAMSLLHSFYCWGHVTVVLLSTLYFVTVGLAHWYYLPILWALLPLFNTFLYAFSPIRSLDEDGEILPVRKLFSIKIFWIFLLLMICSAASEQAMAQWSSLFAESGLKVSKTLGDLLGPCSFAVCMGLTRVFYGKRGNRISLKKFLAFSSILCTASYLIATLSPFPLLSLAGCALCGLSVGIMWPGSFSLAAEYCPAGGTGMFAILALAGDIGCSLGPGLVGTISNAAVTGNLYLTKLLFGRLSPAEAGLKTGLITAVIFPLLMILLVACLNRFRHASAPQTPSSESVQKEPSA